MRCMKQGYGGVAVSNTPSRIPTYLREAGGVVAHWGRGVLRIGVEGGCDLVRASGSLVSWSTQEDLDAIMKHTMQSAVWAARHDAGRVAANREAMPSVES